MSKRIHQMSRDELWAFWLRYRQASRKEAAELCGETRAGYIATVKAVASYACNLAVAKDCRRRKDQLGAKIYMMCADVCLEGVVGRISHLL